MSNMEFRFESNRSGVDRALRQALQQALNQIGSFVQAQAKALAPVGQYDDGRVGGRLRDSIDFKVSESGQIVCIIGSDVEYAVYVEKGTYKMEAQPYLTPSVEQNISQIKALVENALNTYLR